MRNYQMVLWQMYQAKKRTSSLLHFYDSLSQVVNSMYFIWTIAAVNLKGICRDLTITDGGAINWALVCPLIIRPFRFLGKAATSLKWPQRDNNWPGKPNAGDLLARLFRHVSV